MFNAGVRGKRAKDGVGFLSTAEQFNQKSFLVPTVTSFSVTDVSYVPLDNTAVDTAGGETIVINGSGFAPGATVQVGATTIGSVTYIDQNRLAFSAPALSSGSYTIYVTNSNGGTGILVSGLVYSGLPTYSTSAGSLGTVYETANINTAVVATGDAPITYTLLSGTLPSGATLNSNGTITGNAPVDGSSTTYSFTIQASDAQLQDSTRAFTLTINTDVLSWSLANNTVYSLDGGTAMSNVTLSATSAANSNSSVTFAANTLPTGVSLSGNTIYGTPTTEQTVYSALTATASQTGRTATRYVSWVISVADAYWKYTTLAIQGPDTTFVDDASTNNFAVTVNGDTKPNNFNPYSPGYYSIYNNDSSDTGFGVAANSALNLTADFTIECWALTTALPTNNAFQTSAGGYQTIFGTGPSNSGTGSQLYIGTTNIYFDISSDGSGPISVAHNMMAGAWYHIAVTRSGTTFRIFINGVLLQTATSSASWVTGYAWGIQRAEPPGSWDGAWWRGYISNFRVIKGTAIYTQAFTPSTTPLTAISGTQLLVAQSNRFIDTSTNNFTITYGGGTKPQIFSSNPFTPNSSYSTYGSAYFDGSGDWISVPNNAALAFGTGDFTVECWGFITGSSGTVMNYTNGQTTNANFSWEMYQYSASEMWFSVFDGSTQYTAKSTTFKINQWNHLAAVRSGNTLTLYVNGVAGATTVSIAGVSVANLASATLKVGSYNNGSSYITGYITDVRVVKGTAVYTTAFTTPSAPLTAITNTSLLTLQNNQPVNNQTFLDNSSNNLLVTRAGNATQGTFSPYGGNWSNYFGGQMVSTLSPASTNFNLTGDFTLEAWVYITALPGGSWGILDARASGATAASWLFSISGAGKSTLFEGTERNGTTTVTLNTWHHVAWVRNGSALRGYLDGVLDYYNGSYGTGALSPGSTSPVIGTKDYGISAAWGTTGYISNLRVVNGTAVYTTSSTTVGATIFTPSTTPLTPIANTVLLSCQTGRFNDNSVNNYTITPSSSTISAQRFSPFNPSSVTPTSYSGYFGTGNGNSLYLSAQVSGTGGVTLSGDYTIEMWLYPTAASGSGYSMLVATNTNGGVIQFYYNSSGALGYYSPVAGQLTTSSSPLTFNAWQHVALVRSSNVVKVYVNGVEKPFSSTITDSSTVYANYIGGLGTVYNTFGYISNLRVNNTAIYTSGFTPPTSPLTAISGTQLLTLQSTRFIDNSTNNYTISTVGSPQPTIQNPFGYTSTTTNGYSVSTIGGSGYYDGSGDSIASPQSATFNLSSGDWTIEAWYYSFSVLSQSARYLTITPSSGTVIGVLPGSGGFILNYFGSSSPISTSIPATLNAWQHIALVKNGSTTTLYINGVAGGSGTPSWVNADTTIFFGGNTGSYAYDYSGYISDARVVKGTALYTSNFVPPSQPLTAIQNTSFLLNYTGAGIYDAAMMNDMETVGDAKLSTAVSKFGGSSMYFDGTGDYLYIPSAQFQNFNFGTGDFTIECWLYQTAFSGDTVWMASYLTWASSVNFYCATRAGSPNVLLFRAGDSVPITLVGNTGITANTWTHVAITRASGVTRMFVGGVLQTNTHTGSVNISATVQPVGIGAANNGSEPINGYIDDLRITKGYARYTSNFTPPTSAFKTK